MFKSLILKTFPGGATCLALPLFSSDAFAIDLMGCNDGRGSDYPVPCDAANAQICVEINTAPLIFPGLGFAEVSHGMDDIIVYRCPGGGVGCGAATQVPELEDYAAAAFLVLALTIGWQMRRRNLPLA